ncbi:MAG TPA: phosphatase PAP2 family protein [Solirubrobacteraceae bacterium]|nr:phosphatase PAP2 family protein [Solirubrobacteraceae bacterium]
MRLSKAIRATAWGMVAAGIAAPLIRKRVQAPPLLTQAVAFSAPVGLAIAVRRSPRRDVAICALQMWAYLAAYKAPHDDASGQAARVHIKYPIVGDRILGLGKLPTTRLQRALARTGPDGAGGPEFSALDRVLVWAHWSWFLIPHGSLLYILVRHPRRFSRAAVLTYAVFDVGASFYWVIPTAPPWYAAGAREDGASGEQLEVRRMMVEYGEHFWRDGWGSLYSVFGGNPLAAMPSLHFATSLMAALLLAEVGPLPGALGAAYTGTLGFALVYLGEHYVVDLLAGAALTLAVRRAEPLAGPAVARIGRAIGALEGIAHPTG